MLKRRRAIPAVANDNTTEKTKSCSVTRCLHTLLEELHSQPRAGPHGLTKHCAAFFSGCNMCEETVAAAIQVKHWQECVAAVCV